MEKHSSGEVYIREMFDSGDGLNTLRGVYTEAIEELLGVKGEADLLGKTLESAFQILEGFPLCYLERLYTRVLPVFQRRKDTLEQTLIKMKNTSNSAQRGLEIYHMSSIADVCREQMRITVATVFLEGLRIEIIRRKIKGEIR